MGSHKMSRSLHPPTTILKVYIEAITKSNHVFIPDGLHNTLLSQGSALETATTTGNCGQQVHPKDGEKSEEALTAQAQLMGHVLSMSSSNIV